MSRNYSQTATAIWRNDDFRALTESAQRMYWLLKSQQDISAAGVLHLSVTRWASHAKDSSRGKVVAALTELQEQRFIVLDTETEEVLVRSFVRWDNGYANPKRIPVIRRAAAEVLSVRILRALVREFERLGISTDGLADRLSGSRSAPVSEAPSEPVDADPLDDTFSQANRLSDSQSPSDGVVVTKAVVGRTSTHNPQPVPPPAVAKTKRKQPTLDGMPETPPPEDPSIQDRAFGLAREWIKLREAAGTPIVTRRNVDPLHALRQLIEPLAKSGYTDDEIRLTLKTVNEGLPSARQVDRAAAGIRAPNTNTNGRPPHFNSPTTGANRFHDSQDRRPTITGVIASQAVAQNSNGGAP